MGKTPLIPNIAEKDRTPIVTQLLEIIRYQAEMIQHLKDEIAILKGNKPKPKINPSKMENGRSENKNKEDHGGKRPGSMKMSKSKELKIHETIPIPAKNVPHGSRFKGYKDFIVQGLIIQSNNIRYRLERWQTPNGNYIEGELPASVHGHFDSTVISYVLYQYYQCHVTQPLLLEQLHEFGIEISEGQINRILVEGQDSFHEEKDSILSTGLEISPYINVDDTGARHNGKNGFCTHIGNKLFAWFKSTESKSRINFLDLLRAGSEDYCINEEALRYMKSEKLPETQLQLLENHEQSEFRSHKRFSNKEEWESYLKRLGFNQKRHILIATEGALIGTILENGINPDIAILSDDAGQFNVFLHALCWVHAERTIHKIIPYNDSQRFMLESVRNEIWNFYNGLKTYKENPTLEEKHKLENRFDEIFRKETSFITLDLALKRLYKNKAELLLVLERPEIPLHNNTSETDIREYVKRRKVSGSTRSLSGRQCRDTFTSLKKTCRKLGISFWDYLKDRTEGLKTIPQLSFLMRQRAPASTY